MRAILCHNYYREEGGENAAFRNEVELLRRHGVEVVTYTRASSEIEGLSFWEKIKLAVGAFFSLRTFRELRRLVDQVRPDVAIVQNVFPLISPSAYAALRRAGVPVVQLTFNYRFACANAQLYTRNALCERCVRGSVLNAVRHRCLNGEIGRSLWYALVIGLHRWLGTFRREIDRVVVPHPFVGRKLVEFGVPARKIRHNPNPFFLPAPAPESAQPPYVLYVGRLIAAKGVLTLARAMAHVPPPTRLIVVGDGNARGALESFLASAPGLAGRVVLKGRLWGEEVDALMRGMSLLVQPSEWYDPSPMTVYTSMALGKPTVVSDLGSATEIVTDGVDGLVFRVGDPVDLARKINRLLEDEPLRRAVQAAARAKAERDFSDDAHFRRISAVIAELT
jgi:glycosyltransferase involved in cell wall biosynthesis